MQPLEMAERMHELEKKLEIAVTALTNISKYGTWGNKPVIWEGAVQEAKDALLAIQGKQVGE